MIGYRGFASTLNCLPGTVTLIGKTEEIGSLETTEAWNLFSTTIDGAIEDCIPTFHPSTRKNIYSYMTREALHLKNFKNRLWRKYLQTHHHSNDYALARNNLGY